MKIEISQVIESNKNAAKKRRSNVANRSSEVLVETAMPSQDNSVFHEIMKQEDGIKNKVEAVNQQKFVRSGVEKVQGAKREDEIVKQRKKEVLTSVFGDVTSEDEAPESVVRETKEKRIKIKRPKFEF